MDQLLRVAIFWVSVACCAVATLAIVRATIVGGAAGAATPRQRAIEIAYAVVPAVALALTLAATWPKVRDANRVGATPAAPARSAALPPAAS